MTMPCKPKDEGHLCGINLRTEMKHSLQKNLHKYFNKEDIPWVHIVWEKNYSNGKLSGHTKKGSFLWRDILKLLDSSKGMTLVNIHNGESCLLWLDLCLGRVPSQAYNEIFSFLQKKYRE